MAAENSPIIISGAHSSIGQLLIQRLISRELSIIGIVSPWAIKDNLITDGRFVKYLYYDLNKSLPDDFKIKFMNSTYFVHLAWARPKNTFEAKIMNEKMFYNIKASLPEKVKIIFMSTVCATNKNASNYGQSKYNLSQILRNYNSIEIIAGLLISKPVIGPYLVLKNFLISNIIKFTFLPSPPCFLSTTEQIINGIMRAILNFETHKPIIIAFKLEPVALNALIKNILNEKDSYSLPLFVPTNITVKLLLLLRKLFFRISIFDRMITLLTVSSDEILSRVKIK